MSPSPHLPPDALVAHAGFLRALAHSLLRGDDRLEDAVQDTYVAALHGGPSHAGRERGWLASVLRRRIARLRRSDARRERALDRAPPQAPAPSAAAAAERAELIGRLTRALLALPEPYREALVLRYYEDLAPSSLAARLGVPVETARTRVKRGLERLRVALDAEHADGRRAWTGALAELLGRPGRTWPLAVPAAVLAAGALLALGALGVLDPVERARPEPAPAAAARAGPPLLQGGAPPDAPPAPRPGDSPPAAPGEAPPSPAAAAPATPSPGAAADRRRAVFGRVTDDQGRPVPGARLEAWSTTTSDVVPPNTPLPPGPDPGAARRLATALADAQGRYTLGPLPVEPVELRVRAAGHASRQGLRARPGRHVDLVLEPEGALAVRVLAADGSPVAASVRVVPRDGEPRLAVDVPAGTEGLLDGLPPGPAVVVAASEGGPPTTLRAQVEPGRATPLELRLRPQRRLRLSGRAQTPQGAPVPGAELRWNHEGLRATLGRADAEGRFTADVDVNAQGTWTLTVDGGERGWWQRTFDLGQGRPLWSPQLPPELFPGEAPQFRLGWKPLPEGEVVATLGPRPAGLDEPQPVEARVVDAAGRPVPGAQVRRNTGERTITDAEGRFRLGARRKGDLTWFEARGPGGALGVCMAPVEGEPGPEVRLVPVVPVCVSVRAADGSAAEGVLVVLRRDGPLDLRPGLSPEEQVANLCRHDPDAAGLVATTDARGEACLVAPAGRYLVQAQGPGGRTAPASVELPRAAPALALALKAPRVVRGTVRDAAGRPLAGARIRAFTAEPGFPQEAWSRADGSFVLEDAPTGPFRVAVQHGSSPKALHDVPAEAPTLDLRLP